MAAVGLNTSVKDVQGVGPQPFLVGAAGAATVAGTGMCVAFAALPIVDLGDNLIHVAAPDTGSAITTSTTVDLPAPAPTSTDTAAAAAAIGEGVPASGSVDPRTGALLGGARATLVWGIETFCFPR